MIYLGIDPGLGGALAIIYDGLTRIDGTEAVSVFDTPTAEVRGNGKKKREYLIANMVDTLMYHGKDECESFCVIESVHSMPGQGVSSSFSFGRGLGIWEGVLSALHIPYVKISPQTWKKALLQDMPRDSKDSSRIVATRLFPGMAGQLSRKRDDGRAEAILLAQYGRHLALRGSVSDEHRPRS